MNLFYFTLLHKLKQKGGGVEFSHDNTTLSLNGGTSFSEIIQRLDLETSPKRDRDTTMFRF